MSLDRSHDVMSPLDRSHGLGLVQESLSTLLPDHAADHADHAAGHSGLHHTTTQGVLAPLPDSNQQQGPRPDDVIVACSASGASCTAHGSVALDRPPDASAVNTSSRSLSSSSPQPALAPSLSPPPPFQRPPMPRLSPPPPPPAPRSSPRPAPSPSLSATFWLIAATSTLLVPATAHAFKSRNTPAPRVGGLVLGLLLSLAHTASAFGTTQSLKNALIEWCTNAANAETTHGPISTWDVSGVTDFSFIVSNAPCCSTFDEDLNAWDVGRATTMKARARAGLRALTAPGSEHPACACRGATQKMFRNAAGFNQPLAAWSVGRVTDMEMMFYKAEMFNQPLSSWAVGNVSNMVGIFRQSYSFNQPLGTWDTSQVVDLANAFRQASVFNQPLPWDVRKVSDFYQLFYKATAFNQQLPWDVRKVSNFKQVFYKALVFDQPLDAWVVSNATDMTEMFYMTSALSDCNKLLIHTSFESQASVAWTYDWASITCACGSGTESDGAGECIVACARRRLVEEPLAPALAEHPATRSRELQAALAQELVSAYTSAHPGLDKATCGLLSDHRVQLAQFASAAKARVRRPDHSSLPPDETRRAIPAPGMAHPRRGLWHGASSLSACQLTAVAETCGWSPLPPPPSPSPPPPSPSPPPPPSHPPVRMMPHRTKHPIVR